MSLVMTLKFCVFKNMYNTFYDLQYHYCHSTILHGSYCYETECMRWTHGTHTSSHYISITFFKIIKSL